MRDRSGFVLFHSLFSLEKLQSKTIPSTTNKCKTNPNRLLATCVTPCHGQTTNIFFELLRNPCEIITFAPIGCFDYFELIFRTLNLKAFEYNLQAMADQTEISLSNIDVCLPYASY